MKLTNNEIHKRFIDFYELCRESNNIYSVLDACKKVDIDYKQLKKWYKATHEPGDDAFIRMASFTCNLKVGRAYNNGTITKEQAEKYLVENGEPVDELAYFHEQAKQHQKKVEERKKSLEGMSKKDRRFLEGIHKELDKSLES